MEINKKDRILIVSSILAAGLILTFMYLQKRTPSVQTKSNKPASEDDVDTAMIAFEDAMKKEWGDEDMARLNKELIDQFKVKGVFKDDTGYIQIVDLNGKVLKQKQLA